MNTEQAKEYAKTMTYSEAIMNLQFAKGIQYKKATRIKLLELARIADLLDKADNMIEFEKELISPQEYEKWLFEEPKGANE